MLLYWTWPCKKIFMHILNFRVIFMMYHTLLYILPIGEKKHRFYSMCWISSRHLAAGFNRQKYLIFATCKPNFAWKNEGLAKKVVHHQQVVLQIFPESIDLLFLRARVITDISQLKDLWEFSKDIEASRIKEVKVPLLLSFFYPNLVTYWIVIHLGVSIQSKKYCK